MKYLTKIVFKPKENLKNQIALGKNYLVDAVKKISLSDSSSLKLVSSMLSTLTKNTDENSRYLSVNIF